MNNNTLKPHTRLRDYVIKRILGRGSFGVTYLAEQVTEHMAVAIKEYFPVKLAWRDDDGATVNVSTSRQDDGVEDFQSGLDKFLEESRTLSGLHSPHIVQVADTFEYNGTAYMVMKYEEGGTLGRYLKAHQRPLEEAEILAVFIPLLEGLRTIHAKWLLHRDIKPENIYIRKNGSPLLIDFGSARDALSAKRGGMTEYLTPGFAPPEQYDRNADHGPWTDIYAVGATMYYCVTRITPFEGRIRNNQKDPVISATLAAPAMYDKELLELIDWMMDPDYKKRPQSAEEVLFRLQGLKDGMPRPAATVDLEPEGGAREKKYPENSGAGESQAPGAGKVESEKTAAGDSGPPAAKTERLTGEKRLVDGPPARAHSGVAREKQRWAIIGVVSVAVIAVGVVAYMTLGSTPEDPGVGMNGARQQTKAKDTERQAKAKDTEQASRDGTERREEEVDNEAQQIDIEGQQMIAAWKNAMEEQSPPGFARFMEQYPDSAYVTLARINLNTLEKKFWRDVDARGTADAYRQFMKIYPDSALTKLAEQKLKSVQ